MQQRYMQVSVEATQLIGTEEDLNEINHWLTKRGTEGKVSKMPGGEYWYSKRGQSDIRLEVGEYLVLQPDLHIGIFDEESFGYMFQDIEVL